MVTTYRLESVIVHTKTTRISRAVPGMLEQGCNGGAMLADGGTA